MAWTKITRPQYRRDGLRYASHLTDAEWALIEPLVPPASRAWAAARNRFASIRERDPLHCFHGLPVAAIAEGFSTLFHRSGLFLRVVAQRNLCLVQSRARHGGARDGWARGEPDSGRDRQPVGENHRERRPAGLRRGKEDQGPQASHRHRHARQSGRAGRARSRHTGSRRCAVRVRFDPFALSLVAPCLRRRRLCRREATRGVER